MSKNLTRILVGMLLGIFLLGLPPAQAIFGIRAVRRAIMAKKAEEKLAETPDTRTEDSMAKMKRLEQESKAQ